MIFRTVRRVANWRVRGYTPAVQLCGLGILALAFWMLWTATTRDVWNASSVVPIAVSVVVGSSLVLNDVYLATQRRRVALERDSVDVAD